MIYSEEQIELYIKGKLDAATTRSLESEMAANPQLLEEVAIQQSIQQGIITARKAELKARLESIPVSLGWNTLSQIVIGVSSLTIIAVGIYFYRGDDGSNAGITNEISVIEDQNLNIEPGAVDDQQEIQPENGITNNEIPSAQGLIISEAPKTKAPAFTMPAEVPQMDEDVISSSGSEKKSFEDVKSELTLENIKVDQNSVFRFHYRFDTGEIILYGPFDDRKFEIMEINENGERLIYMAQAGQFYKIDFTGKQVMSLERSVDETVIKKLKDRRNPLK